MRAGSRARRLPLALAIALLGCGNELRGPSPVGRACPAEWRHDAAAPLLLGDSLRLVVGRREERAGCIAPAPGAVRWTVTDTAVVTLGPDGWLVGRRAGLFAVRAVAASVAASVAGGAARVDTLDLAGFVFPRDYRARIDATAATVAVGDTVMLDVRPEGADGTPLPPVPFRLGEELGPRPVRRLGEPRRPDPVPVVRVLGHPREPGPRPVVALRPGVAQLRGTIGDGVWGRPSGARMREARVALRVLPSPPRPGAEGGGPP